MDRRRERDALLGEARHRLLLRERRDVDLDEVRLDPVGVDGEPASARPLREPLRAGVVVGEPLDVVVERVDAGGRDDAAWRIAPPKRCFSRRAFAITSAVAGEDRAERAAEPLREAERDGVEARADLGRVDPERDGCVQQPGAVEVEAQVELERERAQLADLLQRPDPAAARVVRVLDPEQARPRRVNRRDAVRGADLIGAEPARDAGEPARDDARSAPPARRARR